MIIRSVELNNFRNYENVKLDLDSEINIFYGDNAQGKTNFLEAAYLCGTTKSHRGSKDKDMIRFGSDESHVTTIVEKVDHTYRIDLHLRKNKSKGISIDRIPIKKASELFGILNIIFFSPEDLNIIKNGPSERRRFLDNELCQLDKIYLDDLKKYNKVLEQRNQLLKDIYRHPELKETLDVWDLQLVEYGKRIIARRNSFVEELNEIVSEIHGKLTKNKEEMLVKYEPSVEVENFEDKVFLNRDRDIRYAQTSCGPHRDDILIRSNNIDMRKYGSQGQQRTCALSLKLSEIKLVEKTIHDKPVLMLDDVLSELDRNRQNDLLSSIDNIQTLITCTGIDDFVNNRFPINKVFHVMDGIIE